MYVTALHGECTDRANPLHTAADYHHVKSAPGYCLQDRSPQREASRTALTCSSDGVRVLHKIQLISGGFDQQLTHYEISLDWRNVC